MSPDGIQQPGQAIGQIPVVTVSYNSPDLIREVLGSFRKFYSNPYYIIDGSEPRQLEEIRDIAASFEGVELVPFGYNIHHGPGMAWAIANLPHSGRVLFLDSDVSVIRGGFLESLAEALRPGMYGVGNVCFVNEAGIVVPRDAQAIPYLHPACMLCNLDQMRNWALPVKHGAPMISTMVALKQAGRADLIDTVDWVRNDFSGAPDRVYLFHDWQGTVKRTGGYHLEEQPAPGTPAGPPADSASCNPDLLRFMPQDARSLIEIGCGDGTLAAAYKRINAGCDYRGVDRDGGAAALAASHCDSVLHLDLETADDAFFAAQADRACWVFGDALGRLRAPEAVLARIRKVLPADGCVVACIPNAQYWMMQARLAIGDYRYEQGGLLDRGSLRQFTRVTIFELFQAAGFRITAGMPRILDEPARAGVLPVIRAMAEAVGADGELAVQDSMALQYVVKAEPV